MHACCLEFCFHHFDFIDGFVVSQSESNVQNILVSNPEVGVPSYGLTEKGNMQAREVRVVQSRTSLPHGIGTRCLIFSFAQMLENLTFEHSNFHSTL